METRPTYVYRLDVTYPPTSHRSHTDYNREWQPADTDPKEIVGQDPDTGAPIYAGEVPFEWPLVKLYLGKSGANARAALLRHLGATVEIVRSKAVTW